MAALDYVVRTNHDSHGAVDCVDCHFAKGECVFYCFTALCSIEIVHFVIIFILSQYKMFNNTVAVFTFSDWSTIFVYLIVFAISMTTFCFMLSVFFSRANTAAAVAGLLWFFLYVPFSFTQANYMTLSYAHKLMACLSSNTAMAYGFQLILRFEGVGEGLQWSNFWHPVSVDDPLTVGDTMLFIIGESILYLLIALYVEKVSVTELALDVDLCSNIANNRIFLTKKVLPGSFGVPEKWYFPFSREYWLGDPSYNGVEDVSDENDLNANYVRLNFEADPQNRHAGVRVKKLRKVYSNKKVACKGLTLK